MASSTTKENEKEKAIEAARLQIEKQFGKGSIMKLGGGARCSQYKHCTEWLYPARRGSRDRRLPTWKDYRSLWAGIVR